MRPVLPAICLWFLGAALPAAALDLTVVPDFTAPQRFYALVDRLKAGEDPDDAAWNILFATPAYKAIAREDYPRVGTRTFMRLAFLPSEATARAAMQADTPGDRVVRHLIAAEARRDEVLAYLAGQEAGFADAAAEAAQLLAPYVPAALAAKPVRVPVAFALFDDDLRGYADMLVPDALFALEAGDNLKYWLAHELHHHYRAIGRAEAKLTLAGDRLLYRALDLLGREGIAGLIDKPVLFYGDGYRAESRMAEAFRHFVDTGPATIEQMDGLLGTYAEIGDGREMLAGDFLKTAPMGGHPTGFYMARLIERELGRDQLLTGMSDPFEFIRLYNKAAKKTGQPGFFGTSQKTLKRLEKAAR